MKVPLDLLLRLVEKMMIDLNLEDIAKKINKHFETPEEDYNDILSDVSLKEMIMEYINNNKSLKKKIKEKIKKLTEESEDEEKEETKRKKRKNSKISNNEEEEEKRNKTSTKKKKRKNSKVSNNEELNEEEEERTFKNKKRKNSNTLSEEKVKKKRKKKEESIDLEKEVKFIPKPKGDSNPERKPFKRIDDTIKNNKLKDNSYEAYMKNTGDNFGKAANDKLIITRGKDFRKEKNKFKNKTFHGGFTISQNVRSTKLYNDSDSDN